MLYAIDTYFDRIECISCHRYLKPNSFFAPITPLMTLIRNASLISNAAHVHCSLAAGGQKKTVNHSNATVSFNIFSTVTLTVTLSFSCSSHRAHFKARTVIKISCKEGQVPHLTKNLVKQLKPWRSIRRQFFCRIYLSRLSTINEEIFADLLFLQLRVLGAGSNDFLEKFLTLGTL